MLTIHACNLSILNLLIVLTHMDFNFLSGTQSHDVEGQMYMQTDVFGKYCRFFLSRYTETDEHKASQPPIAPCLKPAIIANEGTVQLVTVPQLFTDVVCFFELVP